MSATFDPALGDDVSWVRLLIGDTDVTAAQLQDETIEALLTEALAHGASAQAAKYCAAAQAGEVAAARWQALGKSVVERQVSKLRIRYSEGQALAAYRTYLQGLKQRCTHLSLSEPVVLKAW